MFGHYGDRIGRKATLVAALLTMGISTVIIGKLQALLGAGLPNDEVRRLVELDLCGELS